MDARTVVQFERPPVRSVGLTVFFSPIAGMQVSHFSALRERWREQYPSTSELPPLRSQNRGGEEAKVVPVASSWPFPYLLFTSSDETSWIAIQNDRIECGWTFNGESQYPGFGRVSGLLRTHLSEVAAVIRQETGEQIEPYASRCIYLNELPEMNPVDMMVGFTTRWKALPTEVEAPATTYAGVRLHLCGDDALDGCSVNMSVDIDDDGYVLAIESSYELHDTEHDEFGGIDRAHAMLINKFLEYTSKAMHDEWGRVQ